MEPEAFEYALNSAYEYIYNNESELAPLQYPLAMSRYLTPRFANDLYTDNTNQYFTYSGASNSLIVTKEKDGRYKNLTLRAYSGDSFKFYFQAGSGITDSELYFSGPLTTSGVYSTMTQYSTQSGALANAITFSAPADNSSVYTLPSVQNLNWIRLYHGSADGVTPYRIYQFLPRTLIQVDDLEADVIDAVTVRVSDSIVIGPNLIGDKSILGQKIVDGTLSGILLTDGTITGTKVQARTISGILITAGSIKGENIEALTISGSLITANAITAGKIAAGTITFDKIASNTLTSGQIANGTITGQNILAGTVSGVLITDDAISASKILANTITASKIAVGTITGDRIFAGTISGSLIAANTITANKLSVTQLDAVAANMGTLTVNSGITIGTNGTIWAGAGSVSSPTTGLKIYTTGGVSRLTTYDASTPQVDIGSDGKLTAGAGNVTLDSTGISIGTITTANPANEALRILGSGGAGNIVGMAFYNGSYSPINPQITIQADSTNALEIENNAVNGIVNFNFPASGLDNSSAINIYNANLQLVRSPVPPEADKTPGALIGFDSDDTIRYKISHEGLILNNNSSNTFTVNTSTGDVVTSGVVNLSNGSVTNPSLTFNSDPDTGIYRVTTNTLGIATGGAQRASISTTTANFTGKVTSDQMGYLTVRRTADVAITTAGTTITWQSVTRSNNITVATDTITIPDAGYYMFSATFATVANLTSLRMTLQRGAVNYVSTLHGAGLGTGVGYIFNFSVGFWATAGSTYKVVLTPSANTTLVASAEGTAGPSPIMNIFQAIGV